MVMTITPVTNPECGYLKKFKHVVDLKASGVNSRYIQWCDNHCQYNWGWHFWLNEGARKASRIHWNDDWLPPEEVTNGTKAYMSFQNYEEMIIFKITCLSA